MTEPSNIEIEMSHDQIVNITMAADWFGMTFNDFVIEAAMSSAIKVVEDSANASLIKHSDCR